MKTCVESQQKQTIGLIFNVQNPQLLSWSLPTEEIFQVHGQNRPVANLLAVDFFVLSCEKMKLPKPLNTKLSVFLFCILCFPPSRKV